MKCGAGCVWKCIELQNPNLQSVTQETFWNYGASSDKWIPPEHRVKSKPMSDHAVRFANRDIPYRWDPTSSKVGRGREIVTIFLSTLHQTPVEHLHVSPSVLDFRYISENIFFLP